MKRTMAKEVVASVCEGCLQRPRERVWGWVAQGRCLEGGRYYRGQDPRRRGVKASNQGVEEAVVEGQGRGDALVKTWKVRWNNSGCARQVRLADVEE